MLSPNQIWVVTGAASGMGRAITRAAVSQSATVIAVDINEQGLADLSNDLGESCRCFHLDIRDGAGIARLAESIEADFGCVDVLVNNAGAAQLEPAEALTEAAIDFQYEILLRGPMLMVKSLLPSLRRSQAPCIINISSIGAIVNVPHHSAYASFKSGLEKFSHIVLRENPGIRVNVVEPGFIDTPLLLNYGSEEDVRAMLDAVAARLPSKRIGTPEDIAHAVLFLASSDASYVNGAHLRVDGGYCSGPFDFGG